MKQTSQRGKRAPKVGTSQRVAGAVHHDDPMLAALATLRDHLLQLGPTGEKGFEGLVADAIAEVTKLVVRLAPSGFQGGRDGSSLLGEPFAIALEGKLYRDDLRLEDLAGKAVLAGNVMSGKVDVWALCATSAVGDATAPKLVEVLEKEGVTLLLLDWTPRPLPPLAVLLVAAREATLRFFATHAPQADPPSMAQLLDVIAIDAAFPDQKARLRSELTASRVGLDALRRSGAAWMDERLRDRELSRLTFGQYISVAASDAPAQPRTALAQQLAALVTVARDEVPVVAVLGGEGVGKTWLVAQWWAALSVRPILVMVAGRRSERLDAADPLTSVARLLADQDGSGDGGVEPWKRRLSRWKSGDVSGELRFVIVLDGLNERSTYPWAEIIRGLAREAQALGGLVVATAREVYWKRDVLPRLGRAVSVRPMVVGDYSPEELAAVLAKRGRTVEALPTNVQEFVRNPRVCALALDLLDRLEQPVELTRGRLLVEYWRARIEERGNGLAHTVGDFDKLLRTHAKAWIAQPKRTFDRDAWVQFSGAASRLGAARVLDDLSEIEEGRFLTASVHDPNAYEFRAETLPHALGLLINEELRDEIRRGLVPPTEALDRILDPVRGFDLVADVVASAVGLACLDEGFPNLGRTALIQAWLNLQNIDEPAFEEMAAYLATRADAFLDVAELPWAQLGPVVREQSLTGLLVYMRDHPAVRASLHVRIPLWLRRWSRRTRPMADGTVSEDRQRGHAEWVEKQLALLTDEERTRLDEFATEVAEPSAMPLAQVAAQLMAGRPLALYAAGLVGWAVAHTVAADLPSADERLSWVLRLNQVDWRETKAAVSALLPAAADASGPMREAAAIALRMLGDEASASRAHELSPLRPGRKWRRVETFCDTNPHDPEAGPGSNLDNARSAAANLSVSETWITMGSTLADHNLEAATPASARFDPQVLIDAVRRVVATAPARTGLALRQLAWRLPALSPVLEASGAEAVREALATATADPGRLPPNDRAWGLQALVRALVPHLDPSAQLDVLLTLPADIVLYLDTRRGLGPLSADELDARLASASLANSGDALTRTLLLAGAAKPELTERSRGHVVDAALAAGRETAACAASVIIAADDPELDHLLLERAHPVQVVADPDDDGHSLGRAVTTAVVRRGRADKLDLVPDEFLEHAVETFGDAAVGRMAAYLERMLSRLLAPIAARPGIEAEHILKVSADGAKALRYVKETRPNGDAGRNLAALASEAGSSERAEERFVRRQNALIEEAHAFERALKDEGAEAAMASPPLEGLERLAAAHPDRMRSWLERLLEVNDARTKGQVRNLGLALACAYASIDGAMAASVLRHLRDARPVTSVAIGDEEVPLYDHLLFGAADVAELEALRRSRFEDAVDDAALAQATIAAELSGAEGWLTTYVGDLAASELPGDKALALTVAGLRQPNGGSERLLAVDWGTAFLGSVASAARKAYRNASWARTWIECAFASGTPVDFWRFCELAKGVADLRSLTWFDSRSANDTISARFGEEARHQIKRAAQERGSKRKETLFGLKKPDTGLTVTLLDRPDRHR